MPPPQRKCRKRSAGWKNVLDVLPALCLSAVTYGLLKFPVQRQLGSDRDYYYIDEEFHVPQARHYCLGDFQKWDPKITTLPGLYLLSAALIVPSVWLNRTLLSLVGLFYENSNKDIINPCTLMTLRAVNAIGAPACLYLSYRRCLRLLLQKRNGQSVISEWTIMFLAMSVAIFPVIYAPYSFLYYTDAWATASVFLWYSFHLDKSSSFWLKIVLAMFSVLCRQTNIAWIVFSTIVDVCRCAEQVYPPIQNSASITFYIWTCITQIFYFTWKKKNGSRKWSTLIRTCWHESKSNIVVIGLFGCFVIFINGGDVVVGDRKAHTPSVHPMQLCYFVGFTLVFSVPRLLLTFYNRIKNSKNRLKTIWLFNDNMRIDEMPKTTFIALAGVSTALVYSNTIAHPYLLADNRHYTFYAWRLLFGPSKPVWLRYLPVPLYAYGLYTVDSTLTRLSPAYKLAYWTSTSVVLCAQFLLEPRYFVVPYLVYRLYTDGNEYNNITCKMAVFEFVMYSCLNLIIMSIFLYRPFTSTMDDSGRLDRFTW
ncbi:dol-P-Glc:Glc(2)Man(9)GlcNAc(2)-PP-Dol alpha-1,2-glucosyltransferase [Adelges cooleyi]|uniref:dol-P-Glc:Glc(2)Man(9)GlcNAc(2)-PP-Dol alpha-1,2-glucosyltransferase n=1 Tax=Adelges cooleyi TaxID=133065 RepID=UPI00217F617F|nr:dol-P-Glc:Glc(2)Man(9)GlcNAc(2)-PP-Dol alpha-1,2-glucosyltransferase [Adelges cooleyi]